MEGDPLLVFKAYFNDWLKKVKKNYTLRLLLLCLAQDR